MVLVLAVPGGENIATGEAVRTEDAGLCLSADFAGEISLGGGTCLSGFKIGDGEKCAERCGLTEGFLPLPAASAPLGTSRLEER